MADEYSLAEVKSFGEVCWGVRLYNTPLSCWLRTVLITSMLLGNKLLAFSVELMIQRWKGIQRQQINFLFQYIVVESKSTSLERWVACFVSKWGRWESRKFPFLHQCKLSWAVHYLAYASCTDNQSWIWYSRCLKHNGKGMTPFPLCALARSK